MYLENLFGVKLGLCKAEAAAQTLKILTSYGFETDYVIKDTDLFFSALSSDKKADKRGLSLALTPEIGSGIIVNGVSMDSVREFFKSPI
jgi:3-dehydroquinate synthase